MLNKKYSFLDVFGTEFKFSSFGQSEFHTNFGLFLSLIFYMLVGSFIGVFGLDMFHRVNPRIITEDIQPEKSNLHLLNNSNFNFAFRLEDYEGNFKNLDGKLFFIIDYTVYFRNKTNSIFTMSKYAYLNDTKCHENSTDKIFTTGKNLSEWSCINFEKENLTLGGAYNEDFLHVIGFYINYCDVMNNYTCTSYDILKKELIERNAYISFLYPIFYFEPNNLTQPLKYYYYNYYTILVPKMTKNDNFGFIENELYDDQDLLFSKYLKSKQYGFNTRERELEIRSDNHDYADSNLGYNLYYSMINISRSKKRLYRRFMKIPDLLASIGGIMSLVLTGGSVMCSFYNKYERDLALFNNIFDFSSHEKAFDPNSKYKG